MNEDLRKRIVDRRLTLKLTQGALAQRAQTSRKTISDFELGRAGLQLTTFNRLLAALGLEMMLREAGTGPSFEELRDRYSDDLGEPPAGNRRIKRAK